MKYVQAMTTNSYQPERLLLTESAAHKIYEIIQEEGEPNCMLRIYIQGGGCSGFQYGFDLTTELQAEDMIIEKNINETTGSTYTVKVLIDPMSLQYLMGAEIDYVEDMNGEQFVIRNPNAKTTCGCGSSFAIE